MAYKYNMGELVDALSKYPRDAPLTVNTGFNIQSLLSGGKLITLTLEFFVPDEYDVPDVLKRLP